MLQLNVRDETSPLKAVVLGIANSPGPIPKPEEAYDPKSLEHILAGTYPREEDMIGEMEAFNSVLRKHGVKVFRPEILENCNQIFSRDIAFVIEDKLIKANILPEREKEFEAIIHVLDVIDPDKILIPPEPVHIEGGDVMPWKDYIFVGTYRGDDYSDYITARTNTEAVAYLKEAFPHKKVKSFDLRKSNTDPRQNALHLDCCFQPIGRDKAILHKNGFLVEEEYEWLLNYFGKDSVFEIDSEEMYQMFSNVFSISSEVIVSERSFTRLNNWLRDQGFTVEEVPYQEIGKQEGLLRCSTLPLIRE
ncbi:dimethylarginine dimethylaminohydrolase family protein [Muriicola sp. SD30]|uniref:dimethylarginine dimethylaminohydrolase family protein n=1 Tax=Muriicola sp. SD30 TaxID=3240936 RepID=UPI00350FD279